MAARLRLRRCAGASIAIGSPLPGRAYGNLAVGKSGSALRQGIGLGLGSRCSKVAVQAASSGRSSIGQCSTTIKHHVPTALAEPETPAPGFSVRDGCVAVSIILCPNPSVATGIAHETGRYRAPVVAPRTRHRHADCRGAVVCGIGLSRHLVDTGAIVVRAGGRWCRHGDCTAAGAGRRQGAHRGVLERLCPTEKSSRPTSGRSAVVLRRTWVPPWLRTVALNRTNCPALGVVRVRRGRLDDQVRLAGGRRRRDGDAVLSAGQIGEMTRRKLEQAHYLDRSIGRDRQSPLACLHPRGRPVSCVCGDSPLLKLACRQYPSALPASRVEAHRTERRCPAVIVHPGDFDACARRSRD